MNRKKRLMCLCLSAMLLLSLIPANVLHAAEPKGPDKEIAYISIFIDGKNTSYMIFASDTEYNEKKYYNVSI